MAGVKLADNEIVDVLCSFVYAQNKIHTAWQ